MLEDPDSDRSFWVVSPNVRYNNRTVPEWRQASVTWKAAFMGYGPDDKNHKQTGIKFAKIIRPGDVILLARRNRNRPEVVGFGLVRGAYRTSLKGFNPPDEGPSVESGFGSLRRLRPFVPRSEFPRRLNITRVLGHTTALRKLHPESPSQREICTWMLDELGKVRQNGRPFNTGAASAASKAELETIIRNLTKEEDLAYTVRTGRKFRIAIRREAKLVMRYRDWLRRQGRRLRSVVIGPLRCDAYEPGRRNLIEAKSSASREHIRMAVGQLLDYSYQARKSLRKMSLAVLLPDRPDLKSLEWLSEWQIGLVWEQKGSFVDNANGQFM